MKTGKKLTLSFRKSFKDLKTVFVFYSSIKTEGRVALYNYVYTIVYMLHMIKLDFMKKLRAELKKLHEQKVFVFQLYIICANLNKIGPEVKKKKM